MGLGDHGPCGKHTLNRVECKKSPINQAQNYANIIPHSTTSNCYVQAFQHEHWMGVYMIPVDNPYSVSSVSTEQTHSPNHKCLFLCAPFPPGCQLRPLLRELHSSWSLLKLNYHGLSGLVVWQREAGCSSLSQDWVCLSAQPVHISGST